jgi:hypothetical protein
MKDGIVFAAVARSSVSKEALKLTVFTILLGILFGHLIPIFNSFVLLHQIIAVAIAIKWILKVVCCSNLPMIDRAVGGT